MGVPRTGWCVPRSPGRSKPALLEGWCKAARSDRTSGSWCRTCNSQPSASLCLSSAAAAGLSKGEARGGAQTQAWLCTLGRSSGTEASVQGVAPDGAPTGATEMTHMPLHDQTVLHAQAAAAGPTRGRAMSSVLCTNGRLSPGESCPSPAQEGLQVPWWNAC